MIGWKNKHISPVASKTLESFLLFRRLLAATTISKYFGGSLSECICAIIALSKLSKEKENQCLYITLKHLQNTLTWNLELVMKIWRIKISRSLSFSPIGFIKDEVRKAGKIHYSTYNLKKLSGSLTSYLQNTFGLNSNLRIWKHVKSVLGLDEETSKEEFVMVSSLTHISFWFFLTHQEHV